MTVGRLSLNPTEGASVKIRCRPLMSGLGNLRALQRNARFWHDRRRTKRGRQRLLKVDRDPVARVFLGERFRATLPAASRANATRTSDRARAYHHPHSP
jgi:hypothetical protein